jgi:hypothetical protein
VELQELPFAGNRASTFCSALRDASSPRAYPRVMRAAAGLLVVCFIACASDARRDEATPQPAAATAPVAAPKLELEARRRVAWGYGCGGNCAQNTRGESRFSLGADGDSAAVADAGDEATTFSSPGSLTNQARHWALSWTGSVERTDTSMTVRLTSGALTCEESQDKGTVPCRHPPPSQLVLRCGRDQLEVGGGKRPIWRCEPDPPIPGGEWSGTPFPWVFGIDDPIDTLHAGEPQPETSYRLRDDH